MHISAFFSAKLLYKNILIILCLSSGRSNSQHVIELKILCICPKCLSTSVFVKLGAQTYVKNNQICTPETWGEIYECRDCNFVSAEIIEGNQRLHELLLQKRADSKKVRRKPVPISTGPFVKVFKKSALEKNHSIGSTDLRQIAKEISSPVKAGSLMPQSSIFSPQY